MRVECLNGLVGLSDKDCPCAEEAVSLGERSFSQLFEESDTRTLVWTENGGVLPTANTDAQVSVYQQGQKLLPTQYTIFHDTATGESEIRVGSLTHYDGATYEVIVIITDPEGRPDDWNESSSGYYLTDYENGLPLVDALFANTDCSEESIWDMLRSARAEAIRDFQSDLVQSLNVSRESRLMTWRGVIGKTEGQFNTPAARVGVQIRPVYRMKDAYLTVKALHYSIETPGGYIVTFESNDPAFSTKTALITSNGTGWERYELPNPIQLPMYSITEESLRYSITIQTNGARTRTNRIFCCKKPAWASMLHVGGVSVANSVNNELNYTGSHMGGIGVEAYFDCDKLAWLCDLEEMNGVDFLDLVARCIQYKGAIKLAGRILESGRVNYYTVLQPEAMQAKRQRLQQLYADAMAWLVQNMPANVSSCWGCDKRAPRRHTLVS